MNKPLTQEQRDSIYANWDDCHKDETGRRLHLDYSQMTDEELLAESKAFYDSRETPEQRKERKQREIIEQNLWKHKRDKERRADRAEHRNRMSQALNYKPLGSGLNIAV